MGNILPYNKYINDTLSTLNFVALAKTITTNPKINFVTKNNTHMMEKQIKSLLEKIEILERNQAKSPGQNNLLTQLLEK